MIAFFNKFSQSLLSHLDLAFNYFHESLLKGIIHYFFVL